MSTLISVNSAEEQPIEVRLTQSNGATTVRRFRGTQADIEAKEAELFAQGYDTSKRGGPVWELEATIPKESKGSAVAVPEANPVPVWELRANDVQKDLLSSHHTLVAAFTPSQIDQIRTEANDITATTDSPTPTDKHYPQLAGSNMTGDALTVFRLIRCGVESVQVEQPVLTCTWSVARGEFLGYAYTGIGSIYTTNSLIRLEGVPNDIAADIRYWTASFTNPSLGTGRPALVFGWRKKAPTQTAGASNRREVQQTWEFGLWATAIYGTAL